MISVLLFIALVIFAYKVGENNEKNNIDTSAFEPDEDDFICCMD